MSQIILDEQLATPEVLQPLRHWITAKYLRQLRPNEIIKDERVPTLLHSVRQPTFVTIDKQFWNRNLRDAKYCLVYFPLEKDQQDQLPDLLRGLLRLPAFRTRAARMGKVVRVSFVDVAYWQVGDEKLHRVAWPARSE